MKNLTLLYFDPTTKIDSSLGFYEREKLRLSMLLKSFPKYIKNLSIFKNSPSLKSKIKRAKIIRGFQGSLKEVPRHQLRPLLGPKIKSLKRLVNYESSPAQFLEQIKLCTALRWIDFGLLKGSSHHSSDIFKACQKMKRLKNLRSIRLPMSKYTGWTPGVLNHLSSSPKLLSRLRLNISSSWKDNQQLEFFHIFFQDANLLRSTTELHLGISCSPPDSQIFKTLVNCYANFQKLKSLNVEISDLVTFFKDFAVPSSIQNLTLDFKTFFTEDVRNEIGSAFTKKGINDQENSILVSFFNKFRDLPYLETLEIFSHFDVGFHWNYDIQYYRNISQAILARISSLKSLKFQRSGHSFWGPNKRHLGPDSSFPEFLKSCNHLGDSLEKLEFGHEKLVIGRYCDLSSSRNKFTKLSTITITGKVSCDIPTLLKQILSIGNSIKIIKLNTCCDKSSKSLLAILKGLYVLQRPGLKIELEIKFLNTDHQHIVAKEFENGIKELQENDNEYLLLERVSLKLLTRSILLKPLKQFLEIYSKKFMHFENSCC